MELIEFRDTCVIERLTGQKDEWDNLEKETVYDGPCLYQEGGQTYSRSIITRNPLVFLPDNEILIQINDSVTVTTEFGRVIAAVAKVVRDINLPWRAGIKMTRIELKQAQGD